MFAGKDGDVRNDGGAVSPELFVGNGQWGYRTPERIVIPPLYDCGFDFTEGLAAVRVGQAWHYIDIEGRTRIRCAGYEAVKPFRNGRAEVIRDGRRLKSTAQGASLKFSRNSLYLHLLNTIVMPQFRNMTPAEIAAVESLWLLGRSVVAGLGRRRFHPFQLLQSHLEGKVVVGSGARIIRSRVCNYHIGEGALVEGVTALECRRRSTFGNGVGVATMNECGGRTVKIYDRLSAQAAYLMAVYRHRPQTMAALEKMVDDYAEARASQTGSVGKGSRIVGARFIREVRIGDNVTVDGCSILENGTVCDGAHIGVDVKAYDFIAAENARIDNGSIVERCFVGESCRLDKAFTAAESLFFANSHCENGEAASIFAGPYTVSHHKSSLLIAGMFSFFNAGSGSEPEQPPVQERRRAPGGAPQGCKFASGAYIMSPALEGLSR